MFSNDIREIVVDDARGFVYVADAGNSHIVKFTTAGQYVKTWGTEGAGPGQFGGGPRQITVDTTNGNIWAADYGNFRVNVYDSEGNLLDTAPAPARGTIPGSLSQPRDVTVDPSNGKVWVADSWNQRIQAFNPDGTSAGVWGHRGANPPYGLNYPRGVGIDPVSKNIWVVNERGHYIRVYNPDMTDIVMQVGGPEFDDTGTNHLRWPLDVEFWNGRAIVSDRVSERVKVFNATTGVEMLSITRRNWGIAVNPANGDIYVLDQAGDRIYRYSSTGSLISSFGAAGTGNGQFKGMWDAVVYSDTLYVTDNEASNIQGFSPHGHVPGQVRHVRQRPLRAVEPERHRRRPDHRPAVRGRRRQQPHPGVQRRGAQAGLRVPQADHRAHHPDAGRRRGQCRPVPDQGHRGRHRRGGLGLRGRAEQRHRQVVVRQPSRLGGRRDLEHRHLHRGRPPRRSTGSSR